MRKLHLLSELLLKHPLIVLPLLLCHLQCEPTLTPETLQTAQSRVPTSLTGQEPTPKGLVVKPESRHIDDLASAHLEELPVVGAVLATLMGDVLRGGGDGGMELSRWS
jgi:hypothetical protein